ncbi:MAG: orotidine-5'-phosphate decarboxylase [Candidatus Omnitrophica bacterium]|nr:orotidine-5'-phosphate decarboxylase [Candidatus Omnitrophota bacterium]
MDRTERVIVALDTPDIIIATKLVHALKDDIKIFKIGSELFTSCGPEIVRLVQDSGAKVFLDLKFFDIPNTVANVAQVACHLGVFMFNVHALGGAKMMKVTAEAVKGEAERRGLPKPIVLAVTVLTSMSGKELTEDLSISKSLEEEVVHLAKMAKDAGLDGAVASAREARLLKDKIGKDFLVVTPGIRPRWSAAGDQHRIVTPRDAFDGGADYIVIGRPITADPDPRRAVERIKKELQHG